jgi:hypothetical protein
MTNNERVLWIIIICLAFYAGCMTAEFDEQQEEELKNEWEGK